MGRVGRGFQHERHAGQRAGGGVLEQFHAGGQALELEAVIAADAVAGEVLEEHHAAALGHGHELAVVGVVDGVVRRSEGQARLRGHHLDAVDEVHAAPFEVVGDADRVDAVGRGGEAETGIKTTHAAAVVVAREGVALGAEHGDDGVEGRTQRLGERAALEDLALLEGHAEEIDVARLPDDAVEGVSRGLGGDGALLRDVVRFGLEGVVDGREAEEVAGGGGRLGLRVEDELGIVLGGQGDFFGEGITRLEEADGELGAELAAGGIDGVRTTEVADVQAIEGIGRAAVGRFAHHHVVFAVVFGGEGAVAVLAVQDRVVGGGLLEAVLVEDRDVRIHRALRDGGETQAVDLDADALALPHGQLEVVDVLGEDHAFDGLVERDRLGAGELAVGLLLLDVREGAREELAHVRDAGLRAHAHDVVARADGLVDGQGELDLVRGAALDALHLEAGRVEHQVLEIVEARAGDGQLHVGADLAAVRPERRHVGIGRPRG
ncbi:MAG: hypothetical protein RLZZ552_709 [Verrucomicrobiota bacterium]